MGSLVGGITLGNVGDGCEQCAENHHSLSSVVARVIP